MFSFSPPVYAAIESYTCIHGHHNENKYIVENGLDCIIWFSHHISISFFRCGIFMHALQQQHSYWLYIKVIIVEWLEYFEILTFLISNILRVNVWFISWAWLSCKCGCVSGGYVCAHMSCLWRISWRGLCFLFFHFISVCVCLLLTPYSKLRSIIVRKKQANKFLTESFTSPQWHCRSKTKAEYSLTYTHIWTRQQNKKRNPWFDKACNEMNKLNVRECIVCAVGALNERYG